MSLAVVWARGVAVTSKEWLGSSGLIAWLPDLNPAPGSSMPGGPATGKLLDRVSSRMQSPFS